MINFGELELRVNEKYSFVGIEKKGYKLLFHVPKGFSQDDPSLDTFDFKRDLFFKLYRVLNVFKLTCLEKGYFEKDIKCRDRDGVVRDEAGAQIIYNHDGETISYSKLDAIDRILEADDELRILALVSRLGKSETIDYSKLHRFLHKAIFLENGAIYLNFMDVPRKEVHSEASDIVIMYCYILNEVKQQLEQKVSPEIEALAERFRQKYIGSEYSLFNDKYYQQVIDSLKEAFDIIDKYTPLKDSDYWYFYEVIEAFLFGEIRHSQDGQIWGINNFHSVWEAMCLTYIYTNNNPYFLLYLDESSLISQKIISKFKSNNKIAEIANAFQINSREVRPDAVIVSYPQTDDSESMWDLGWGKNPRLYTIKRDNFNDLFAYYTSFSCEASGYGIKIAYADQSIGYNNHTFNELAKFFRTEGDLLRITSLPDKFYSYWPLNDNLSSENLQMMRSLNHIFYVALKSGIFSAEEFELFIEKLNNRAKTEYIDLLKKKSNVFEASLLRDKDSKKEYKDFVAGFYFNVINIKYSSFDYYKSPEKMEEIKSRSIRKQFLYEYLIQKYLEDNNSKLKALPIKSDFWLPVYSQNSALLSCGPKYLDGYVKLTGVSIMAMIDSYLATE
jgi:hypothetical protein